MKIEPSEENLPQVKQADVDITAWEGISVCRQVYEFTDIPLDKLFD